jgi:hypothetical protein
MKVLTKFNSIYGGNVLISVVLLDDYEKMLPPGNVKKTILNKVQHLIAPEVENFKDFLG